jgi:hypothetical protein
VSHALASMAAVEGDKDLVPEAKRRKKQAIAEQTLTQLDQSTSLEKARDSVASRMRSWDDKVAAAVKPASTEAEAVLHGEIRRHVAGLSDERARMSGGSDPAVASALLEAPPFLSNLSEVEIAYVRAQVEQKHLSPEMVEAKARVTRAMAELDRASRAAPALVAQRAGLTKGQVGGEPQLPNAKVA